MTSVTARNTRSEATDNSTHFGQIELDLISTHTGVPFPFPLRVPSFGRITGEREVLFATAGETLRLRGLADDSGPVGTAAELVAALHEHRGTVDLVLFDSEGATGVAAMVYRSSALICVQQLNDDQASTVRFRRVSERALDEELLKMVPDLAPARSMPITLPGHAVDSAMQVIEEVKDDAKKERILRDLVRDNGGDPHMLDQLVGLLPTVDGRGQIGATRRNGKESVRFGSELSWLDSRRGRIRVDRADNGWVSVNPLRQGDVRSEVRRLTEIARRPQ